MTWDRAHRKGREDWELKLESVHRVLPVRGAPVGKLLQSIRPGKYRSLPLLLPLYYPLAMRVAADHILGKFEGKIWIQSFGSSITPSLMPYAASIEVNA